MPGKMDAETIEKAKRFFNYILLCEPKKVERLSRTQAKNALELIKQTLHDSQKESPDRRFNAICYTYGLYGLAEMVPQDICERPKDVSIIAVVKLRNNKVFLRQFKHVLKLHRPTA